MSDSRVFQYGAVGINMIWLLIFALIPACMVVGISFLTLDTIDFFRFELTLSNYRELFASVNTRVFIQSVYYSSGTTLGCLLVGYPFAWFLSQTPKKYQSIFLMLLIVPFWTSSLIRTYALVILMKANGLINAVLMGMGLIQEPLSILYSDAAVFIGLIYSLLPFMILPVYGVLEKMDRELVEAARDLGASSFHTFFRVVLPLSMPGILAGGIMVFLPAMGLFYIPDLLGGAKTMMVGNFIRNQFLTAGNWPFGSAASVFLMGIMALMMVVYLFLANRIGKGNPEGGLL